MKFKLNNKNITLDPVRYIGKEVVIGDTSSGVGAFLKGGNVREITRELEEAMDHCHLRLVGDGYYKNVDYIKLEERNGREARDEILRGLEHKEAYNTVQRAVEHWGPPKAYPVVTKGTKGLQISIEKGV